MGGEGAVGMRLWLDFGHWLCQHMVSQEVPRKLLVGMAVAVQTVCFVLYSTSGGCIVLPHTLLSVESDFLYLTHTLRTHTHTHTHTHLTHAHTHTPYACTHTHTHTTPSHALTGCGWHRAQFEDSSGELVCGGSA